MTDENTEFLKTVVNKSIENVLQKLEINRQSIVDSIENYRKDRAKRSKEINQEEKKKNKLSDPKASELNSKILKN